MTRVETIPPQAPGDRTPWQCPNPKGASSSATHWQRNSLEYCRLTVGQYDAALAAAERFARRFRQHQWIVLMDADETVLDNSLFDRVRPMCGGGFGDPVWNSWVKAGMARDVPGAAAFTHAVHRLGGLIGIITNRDAVFDKVTQKNLADTKIWFDFEIGKSDTDNKTLRWRDAVKRLRQRFGGQPEAVMWVGDQITDFPVLDRRGVIMGAMDQGSRQGGFGTTFFLLPNSMYSNKGGWMDNPDR